MTTAEIDRIFDEHYKGNSAVSTPELERARAYKEALKRQLHPQEINNDASTT